MDEFICGTFEERNIMKNIYNSRTQEFSIALLLGGDVKKAQDTKGSKLEGLDKLLNQWERILDKTVEIDLEGIERRINEDLK